MWALAAALAAGCATSAALNRAADPGISQLEEQSRTIDESEHCMGEAVKCGDPKAASLGAQPGACADLQKQTPPGDRDRKLSACKALADRERAQLSAGESARYGESAEQERDASSLMMIRTTSQPH
jgi:hypothetical protein